MLNSNKIIAIVLLTICSVNMHLNNGFKFPIYEHHVDIRTPSETESIDQLEIDRLDDKIRMRKAAQQQFKLGATVIPPVFESNYEPFIDLATRLPQIIKMFHGGNPMITDEMPATDINNVISFTTIEEDNKDFDNDNNRENTFTTTTDVGSSASAIASASDNDLPPLFHVNNKVGDGEEEKVAGEQQQSKSTQWPITDNDEWKDTKFNINQRVGDISILADVPKRYFPERYSSNFPLICYMKTTLLNDLKVWNYTEGMIWWPNYSKLRLDMKLRWQMYEKGLSEICHDPNKTDFYEYINCAILRNMRMESVHPTYPKIQLPY